jgi:hypothetical protein
VELIDSLAFKQQKQLVYGTLDSRDDLQRAIVQVSNDVKSAEAVCHSLLSYHRFSERPPPSYNNLVTSHHPYRLSCSTYHPISRHLM